MDFEEIRNLVRLISEYNLTEFKMEMDGCSLCIRRGAQENPGGMQNFAPMPLAPAVPASVPAPETSKPAEPERAINSPLVGSFYRSASPEAKAFVNVGDRVTPDTVVCIIEAMKVMNEIKAETSGIIKQVLVENGQPVEYGQPLFVLE